MLQRSKRKISRKYQFWGHQCSFFPRFPPATICIKNFWFLLWMIFERINWRMAGNWVHSWCPFSPDFFWPCAFVSCGVNVCVSNIYEFNFNKKSKTCRTAPREGAYVHGIFMEGARWDVQQGIIMESRLKELHPSMPVINIRVSKFFKH